ncbi:unnamed protein product, partial [Chrysoparadoxa australica]
MSRLVVVAPLIGCIGLALGIGLGVAISGWHPNTASQVVSSPVAKVKPAVKEKKGKRRKSGKSSGTHSANAKGKAKTRLQQQPLGERDIALDAFIKEVETHCEEISSASIRSLWLFPRDELLKHSAMPKSSMSTEELVTLLQVRATKSSARVLYVVHKWNQPKNPDTAKKEE